MLIFRHPHILNSQAKHIITYQCKSHIHYILSTFTPTFIRDHDHLAVMKGEYKVHRLTYDTSILQPYSRISGILRIHLLPFYNLNKSAYLMIIEGPSVIMLRYS